MPKHLMMLGALGLALALPLAACSDDATTTTAAEAPAGPRLRLASSDTPTWQNVSAEIATVDQAQVVARIPGILTTLAVREGDTVTKGQLIGRIVDNQLAFQADALGAQAVQAQSELARVRFLHKNGVYADARLEQAEATASAARAQHAAARAAAAQGVLTAPAAGRVLRADVPSGAPVTPGTVIAVITAGPAILRLEIPESIADKVSTGSRVAAAGLGTGTITKLYPSVSVGHAIADVAFPSIDNKLIGQRIAVQVETGTRKALLIPSSYLSTRYGIDYVIALDEGGSATQVPVQTAPTIEPGKIEILSGVSPGDTLVGPASGSSGR